MSPLFIVESHSVLIVSSVFDLILIVSKLFVIICFFFVFALVFSFYCYVLLMVRTSYFSHFAFNSACKQRIKLLLIIV